MTATKSKKVEPKLSPSDQLKNTMLQAHISGIAPEPNMTVQVGVTVTSIRYDAYETKVTAGLAFVTVRSIYVSNTTQLYYTF